MKRPQQLFTTMLVTKQSRQTRAVLRAWLATLLLLVGMFPTTPAQSVEDSGSGLFELHGTISALPSTTGFVGDWTVAGKTIHVTATTIIDAEHGAPAVGALVEVKGTLQSDGSVNATKIEVQLAGSGGAEIKLFGTVETLPSTPGRIGDWKVAGKTIHVSATTRLEQQNGQIAVGVMVKVEGLQQSDGSINAFEIEVNSGSDDEAKFTGRIEELPSTTGRIGDWKVSGRVVHVTATTVTEQNDGLFAIGAIVKVEGIPQADGSVTATEVETKSTTNDELPEVKFRGTVEALPGATGQIGDWRVSGRIVHVTNSTRVQLYYGPVAVGSIVEVEGRRLADNSVNASEIEVQSQPSAAIRNTPGYCRFFGKINSLPATQGFIGEWNVGGHKLNVVATTTIIQEKAPVAVGALVEVLAVLKAGVLEAARIEVKQGVGNSAGFVRFHGTISTLPAAQNLVGDWIVSNKTIHVTSSTRINQEKGKAVVGAVVEIVGNQRSDGSVDATEIEVKTDSSVSNAGTGFVSFYDLIATVPTTQGFIGDWTIGAKTVHVTAATKIEQERGQVKVGALVEVKGNLRSDGSIDATKIEVKATTVTGGAGATLIEIVGKVTALPAASNLVGDWKVDGRTVRVTTTTFINREHTTIAVSVLVEVKGALQADGSIDATKIEVKRASSFTSFTPVASVSASSYDTDSASEAIIASFGNQLAQTTQAATKLPLPTTLGGVTVLVDDQPAGLFFVSPTQINYEVPANLPLGSAQVTIISNSRVIAQGTLSLPGVAPGLFTADASGKGLPAGSLLRVKDAEQTYEALSRYDAAQNKFVAVPVVRKTGESLYLVLFGTGFRKAPDSDGNSANGVAENIEATIGGINAPVLYAGIAPGFAGLDQLNIELPANVTAGANITVLIKVSDGQGNLLRANTVTIAIQ